MREHTPYHHVSEFACSLSHALRSRACSQQSSPVLATILFRSCNNPIIWVDNAPSQSHIYIMTQTLTNPVNAQREPLTLQELWSANARALDGATEVSELPPSLTTIIRSSGLADRLTSPRAHTRMNACASLHGAPCRHATGEGEGQMRGPDSQSRASFALRPGRESAPSATRSTLESQSQPYNNPPLADQSSTANPRSGVCCKLALAELQRREALFAHDPLYSLTDRWMKVHA